MTPSSFTRAYVAHDLGGDLHRLAQRAAVVAAALYVAGLAVGVVVHWANDWLSGDRRPWPVAWGAAAAPDLWTPAAIATALWLDAADASTITTSGSDVTQVNDKSGNSRNFTSVVDGRPHAFRDRCGVGGQVY